VAKLDNNVGCFSVYRAYYSYLLAMLVEMTLVNILCWPIVFGVSLNVEVFKVCYVG
jgi:hypothetical protein